MYTLLQYNIDIFINTQLTTNVCDTCTILIIVTSIAYLSDAIL